VNALDLLTDDERDRLLHRAEHDRDFQAELHAAWNLKRNLASAEAARMAAASQSLAIAHHEALGQLELVVPPWMASIARNTYGQECFTDAGFRRDFARDNPECNIRSRSATTTITHPGWNA
jgi:hypothetical protein